MRSFARICLPLLLISAASAADDDDFRVAESPLPKRFQILDRMTEHDRAMLVHELAWERQQAFEALIKKLDSVSPDARFYAAFLLGHYRMDQAAPHLAAHIALMDNKLETRSADVWFWGRYPAQEALVRIGKPAVRYLIENLADSDQADLRKLSAEALTSIEGPLASTVLQAAIAHETEDARRGRMQAAVALLR